MSRRFNVILVVLAVMMAMLAVTPGASGTTTTERAEPKCFGSTATIMGTDGDDTLMGTSGNDVIIGMGGNDTIDGMGGDDKLCGKNGVDTIFGGDGDDSIDGGKGNDTLEGDAGDDTLKGGKGGDLLNGGTGDDTLKGGKGGDTLSGGDGDDVTQGNAGTDSCDITDGASTLSSCETTFGTPPSTPTTNTLDISLDANRDETLPTNFPSPDPRAFSISSGGGIDTEYLNGDPQLATGQGNCKGFAIQNPDFQLTYTTGSSTRPLLRFFWIPTTPAVANGLGDAVLIINAPNGKWFCNDDANNTLNPQIDFNNPSTGVYDVYIASRTSGGGANGTLSVTELDSHNSATG